MVVGSGNLNDPPGVNGLAHFCEHMLFLGTERYPGEDTYSKTIASGGGSKNAATSEDYTQFYFDIKNETFTKALPIFAEFFKTPNFTESATEREMNAVDSEFRKNLSNELRRLHQILKSEISIDGCVIDRFSTGNLASL